MKLLFLQLQLCVYGLYPTSKKAMNTSFYTSKKAASQHVISICSLNF